MDDILTISNIDINRIIIKKVNMKVEIFDDLFSIGHVILGVIALFVTWIVIVYVAYQIIEFCMKKGREPAINMVGDIVEFFFGVGTSAMLMKSVI